MFEAGDFDSVINGQLDLRDAPASYCVSMDLNELRNFIIPVEICHYYTLEDRDQYGFLTEISIFDQNVDF